MALKDWKKEKSTGEVPAWMTKERPFMEVWIEKDWDEFVVRSDFIAGVKRVKTKAEAVKAAKKIMREN